MRARYRRLYIVLFIAILTGISAVYQSAQNRSDFHAVQSASEATSSPAIGALAKLSVRGKAPKTGYARDQFSDGWGEAIGCNVRNYILKRDMTGVVTRSPIDCTVLQGTLLDPYTGNTIVFINTDSTKVQIDHVVALSNAWQTGAQQLSPDDRYLLANDPLELLAVDGPTNEKKGDGDAATWLPPNKDYRCRYVARQIAVKQKYSLWVLQAEHDAMEQVLQSCPGQELPSVGTVQ